MLAATIDGRRVAFTGDNIFLRPDGRPFETTVLRNSFQPWMHRRCVDVMQDLAPELVCPGHGDVFPWSADAQKAYAAFVERKDAVFRRLVAEPADAAIDLFWARLVPYVVLAAPGERLTYRLLLRNNLARPVTFGARLIPADGWLAQEAWQTVRLDAGDSGEIAFSCVAAGEPHPRRAMTVELTVDGEPLGPIVEGVVAVHQSSPTPTAPAPPTTSPIRR